MGDVDERVHEFSGHSTSLCTSFFEKLFATCEAYNLRRSDKARQARGEQAYIERRKQLLDVDFRGLLDRQVFSAGAAKSTTLAGDSTASSINSSAWGTHVSEYEDRFDYDFTHGLSYAFESWRSVAEDDWTAEPLRSAHITITQPKSKMHILFRMLQAAARDVVFPHPWLFFKKSACTDDARRLEMSRSLRAALMLGLVSACVSLPTDLPEADARQAMDTMSRALLLPEQYPNGNDSGSDSGSGSGSYSGSYSGSDSGSDSGSYSGSYSGRDSGSDSSDSDRDSDVGEWAVGDDESLATASDDLSLIHI